MRVALSIMLMQECCNLICQWENEPGGVPIRIKHLLHSSAVRYGEIFHSPSARENISPYLTLTHVISLMYLITAIYPNEHFHLKFCTGKLLAIFYISL